MNTIEEMMKMMDSLNNEAEKRIQIAFALLSIIELYQRELEGIVDLEPYQYGMAPTIAADAVLQGQKLLKQIVID